MGWPDSPYLWREHAKPAQEQYAAIATQISEFEPVTMMANPEVRSLAKCSSPPVNSTGQTIECPMFCKASGLVFWARALQNLLSKGAHCRLGRQMRSSGHSQARAIPGCQGVEPIQDQQPRRLVLAHAKLVRALHRNEVDVIVVTLT